MTTSVVQIHSLRDQPFFFRVVQLSSLYSLYFQNYEWEGLYYDQMGHASVKCPKKDGRFTPYDADIPAYHTNG